jgi:DNA/RNA endonuclease YhcR with UshA esterase domain
LGDAAGVPNEYIAVQLLTNDIRGKLNLIDNPNNLGKKVKVYGSLEKYCGVAGMKGTVKAEIDGVLIDCEVVAGEATPVTIAEFNEKPVDANVWYELTGVITGTINTQFGNFDLVDETGKVYVYGLTATPQSVNDKSYASLGLEAGDKIKIRGTRGDYNGKVEVLNAYFVELVQKQAGEPEVNMGDPESATPATIEEFLSKPVNGTVWYELIGTVKEFAVKDGTTDNAMVYGNFTLEDATGSIYVYGLTKEPVVKNDQSFASLGVAVGDRIKIRGVRAEYNGAAQVGNAYLVEELEPEKPQMEGAEGEGTEASPYNVPAAYNNQGAEEAVWVEGYIVGFINRRDSDKPTFTTEGCKEKSNVLIAKEANDTVVYMPVELPSGEIRDSLNLQANPTNLGKKVKVYGMLQEFFFMPGVKDVTKFELQ